MERSKMSRFLDAVALAALGLVLSSGHAAAQDVSAGQKVFAKCTACHAVGEGARNKVGPELNELIGRVAGGLEGYKYSKAMIAAGEGGLVWTSETLRDYLADPKGAVKGTKMAFAGLKKEEDLANVIAYLATYSTGASDASEAPADSAPAGDESKADAAGGADDVASMDDAEAAAPSGGGAGAVFGLGREATPEEIAAWDFDIRPDGLGLPEGSGTVMQGEEIYTERCAACHGDFGEGIGRWPVLAGGHDTLTADRPEKTIGSYWPYLSTVYDYVHRAMPFGDARSLTNDETYALTAYLLYLNDVVTDEEFELSRDNFASVRLPNEANFIEDDRLNEPRYADRSEPCMTDCLPGTAEITMHAAVLDVTPDTEEGEGPAGGID
jgi:cytochrome c2